MGNAGPEDEPSGDESAEPMSGTEPDQNEADDATESGSKDEDGERSSEREEESDRTEGGGEGSTSEGDNSRSLEEDSGGEQDATAIGNGNMLVKLEKERAEHEERLKREVRAREELEDMLLRMEKHFKSEQAARKNVEGHLEQAVQAEMNAKKELEGTIQKHSEEAQDLENERNSTRMERQALEAMRQEFENELQAARAEVAKAQDALKTAEDRVRCSERIDRAKMEAEYQMRIASLGNELERVREELVIRTQTLGEEMERWRLQAEYTAGAIIEAKGEVMERKRDLDVTRERMDRLVEKLFMGREQGIVLHGAISAAQMYNGQAHTKLLASMQNSYYNAVQASLPWGGEIPQHGGRVPALPPSESHMMPSEQMGNQFGHASTRKGAKPIGKGAQQGGTRARKPGKASGAGLPPLGNGGLYSGVPPGHKGGMWGQTNGAEGKAPQRNARQRNKDRFAGTRDTTFGASGKWS